MNRIATHSLLLPFPSSDEGWAVPEWVHLVPAGEFKGSDGRGPWRLTDVAAVITASHAALPLPVDEAHATDLGASTGQPAPARGWIEELQPRADGIWGRVKWTATGTALLSDRSYRGISPTFVHTKGGEVLRLLRAALTNVPNLPQLATLNHQEHQNMDLLAQLRQLHGLAADADEAAALNACRTAHEAVTANGVALNAIATAAGLTPGQDATTLASAIAAARTAAGEAGRMATELTALQGQITTMRNDQARTKAEAVVDAAIGAGKAIPKSLREHYIARHCQDAAAVEKELAAMPALNAGGIQKRDAADRSEVDPAQLALQAQQLQDQERANGRELSIAEAVQRVVAGAAG